MNVAVGMFICWANIKNTGFFCYHSVVGKGPTAFKEPWETVLACKLAVPCGPQAGELES